MNSATNPPRDKDLLIPAVTAAPETTPSCLILRFKNRYGTTARVPSGAVPAGLGDRGRRFGGRWRPPARRLPMPDPAVGARAGRVEGPQFGSGLHFGVSLGLWLGREGGLRGCRRPWPKPPSAPASRGCGGQEDTPSET